MGKAIDKLKQIRNDLVSGKQQLDDATTKGKAQLLKTLKANGIKAESVVEYSLDGSRPAGVFIMGGKKYACQIDSDGVSYGELDE